MAIALTVANYLVLTGFVASVLAIAVYDTGRVRDVQNFFVAGHQTSPSEYRDD